MIFYSYCTFKEILRRDDFHPRIKHLYENYCPGFKQAETRRAPGRDEKCPDFIKAYITNLWRNDCIFLNSFTVQSRLLSCLGSHTDSPLASHRTKKPRKNNWSFRVSSVIPFFSFGLQGFIHVKHVSN